MALEIGLGQTADARAHRLQPVMKSFSSVLGILGSYVSGRTSSVVDMNCYLHNVMLQENEAGSKAVILSGWLDTGGVNSCGRDGNDAKNRVDRHIPVVRQSL